MSHYTAGIIAFLIWVFLLRVLNKSGLKFWHFLLGSMGAFALLFIFLEPVLTEPLAQIVALIVSVPGKLFGMYGAYYKYGVIFVQTSSAAISLSIDLECSGVIEILAFLSLLLFYPVYNRLERLYVGIVGVVTIVFANALRITVISMLIYIFGVDMYYAAHTYVGRLVFYAITVVLYFYVFTKPQIVKQKVGGFSYDVN